MRPARSRLWLMAVLLALAVATPSAGLAATAVKVALPFDSLNYFPTFIADRKGFFKDESLDVEIVVAGSGAKTAAALASGSVQFADTGFDHAIKATAKGRRHIALVGNIWGYPNFLVVSKAALKARGITSAAPIEEKLKALKGLRIGATSPGSSTYVVLHRMITLAGLEPDRDTAIAPMGGNPGPSAVAALDKNQIDAFLLPSPFPEMVVVKGRADIFIRASEVPDFRNWLHVTLQTTPEYLEKNRDTARRYVKAIVRAHHFIKDRRAEALEVATGLFSRTDPAIVTFALDNILPMFPREPLITRLHYDTVLALRTKEEGNLVNVPFDSVVDLSFVEQAIRELK